MDRRNGGDLLAPPRPPKLLPKIHRPRAPEPEMMMHNTPATPAISLSSTTITAAAAATTRNAPVAADTTNAAAAAAAASSRLTEVVITPQCTNHTNLNHTADLSRNNNLNLNQQQQQQQQQQNLSSINHTSPATADATTTTTIPTSSTVTAAASAAAAAAASTATAVAPPSPGIAATSGGTNVRYNRVGCYNNHIGNIDVITPHTGVPDDYQIHHLTFLPQRPSLTASNLSRSGSQISSTSSSSTATSTSALTVTNSFTRRRPPPAVPGSAIPLLTISGGSINNNNNFLNHFQNPELVAQSNVTLAQPRPESERLANEYVDTPLRTAQQLQQATRIQHPAGEHDNGQTTTHHLLLLPQRELRQLQQQQHQTHPQFLNNRLAGAAGSANAPMLGVDGTDGVLHSHSHHPQHHHHNPKGSPQVTGKLSPPLNQRGYATSGIQPTNQPITKQPALSTNAHSCKFAKELPALDELLDIHNIATGIPTSQGMISAINGASPLATPIVLGSSDAPSSLNPITCPRCDRCRCEQCQSPRPLPQTWVCNKTCLCSAESIIDYASCLCCAKALFYHCARDNDLDCDDGSGTPCVDNPCSCGPYKRTQRWGWLGALSLVLPCLWCYWPMRGCVSLCEKCYGRFARRGCRCQNIGSTSSMFPITSMGNANNMIVLSNGSSNGGGGIQSGNTNSSTKSSLHHNHHNECSSNNSSSNRILRKGDFTPEKRLLDSSPEY